MKKLGAIAVLAGGLMAAQAGWAADTRAQCYSQSAIEAEQAIRYLTDVMLASTACQNTTYAEFRLRNRDAIVAYQKAMISHFRGEAAFDRWNTALANVCCPEAGERQSGRVLSAGRDADEAGQGARSGGVPGLCRFPGGHGRRAVPEMRREMK